MMIQGLKARGSVEDWLGKVEEFMFASLKRRMKAAYIDYDARERMEWLTMHPNQVKIINFCFNYQFLSFTLCIHNLIIFLHM